MDSENGRQSYLRWQEIALKQLGYTINLFLTLAGAATSLALKILMESQSRFPSTARGLFRGAVPFLLLSVGAALAANWTRAHDFRNTRRAAREMMINGKDHDGFHDKAECYGKWTWWLFYSQTATFGVGVVLLVASLLLAYGNRI